MQDRLLKVLRCLNVPGRICHHMLGKSHGTWHRMAVGGIVMVAGVLIAKQAEHFEVYTLQIITDLVGYGIHGLGLTPYLEAALEKFAEAV